MSTQFATPFGGTRKVERLRAFVQAEAFRAYSFNILSDEEYEKFVLATGISSRVILLLSEIQSQKFPFNPETGRFNWANIAEWIALNNLEIFAFVLKASSDKWRTKI